MRVLGQDALGQQPLTDGASGRHVGRQLDTRPQAATAHLVHRVGGKLAEVMVESPAEVGGAGLRLAGLEHGDNLAADGARERVPAEGAAVRPRRKHPEYVPVGDDCGQRNDAASEGLAEHVDIGDDVLVVARERPPSAAQSRLDLVGDQQRAGARAQVPHGGEIAVRRHDHAGFALDGLDQDTDGAIVDGRGHGRDVAVRNAAEARRERPEVLIGGRVVGEADDGRGATVEVAVAHHDHRLVGGNALDEIAPPTRGLDGGLHRLGAGVHRQHRFLAAQAGERFGEGVELVVVEGAAGEREAIELPVGGRDEPRVAVAEVERGVGGEEVEVAVSARVADPRALALDDRHRQWVVVVSKVVGRLGLCRVREGHHASVRRGSGRRGWGPRSSRVQHFTPPPAFNSSETSIGIGS